MKGCKGLLGAVAVALSCSLFFPAVSQAADTCTVKNGDSLWTIAVSHGTTVEELQRLNRLTGTVIFPGQVLRVEAGGEQAAQATAAVQGKSLEASGGSYTVKNGDSLWTIAVSHGTTVEELQRLNRLTGTTIFPGQVLRVEAGGEQAAQATAAVQGKSLEASGGSYTVKNGDSLWTIAVSHGTTVEELQRLNQLTGTAIYPGQVLQTGGDSAVQRSQSSASRSGRGSAQGVIQTAYRFLGVPYVYGGSSPDGFDCSGFVQYVFSLNGVTLPRVAADQAAAGSKVAEVSQLQPGDIVCFSGGRDGYIDHNGIYIGNRQFINANSSKGIAVDSLDESWFSSRFVQGTRVL